MIKPHPAFWLACLASLALPFTGLAQKKPRIVVVTHGQVSDPFWNVVHHGVDQAAKDADCTAEYRAPEKFDMVSLAQAIDAPSRPNPTAWWFPFRMPTRWAPPSSGPSPGAFP